MNIFILTQLKCQDDLYGITCGANYPFGYSNSQFSNRFRWVGRVTSSLSIQYQKVLKKNFLANVELGYQSEESKFFDSRHRNISVGLSKRSNLSVSAKLGSQFQLNKIKLQLFLGPTIFFNVHNKWEGKAIDSYNVILSQNSGQTNISYPIIEFSQKLNNEKTAIAASIELWANIVTFRKASFYIGANSFHFLQRDSYPKANFGIQALIKYVHRISL